ncbi:MAG: hypothetical protein Q8M07_16905 [Prosthecobacter sp.]|nr:hypothetical protein [Prosthecobacter sp.]
MPTISVSIPVANFWPSADDLSARDSIMAALDALSFGSSVGCGGGRGAVDFSYEVTDAAAATEIAQRIVHQHLPAAEPQIRITE